LAPGIRLRNGEASHHFSAFRRQPSGLRRPEEERQEPVRQRHDLLRRRLQQQDPLRREDRPDEISLRGVYTGDVLRPKTHAVTSLGDKTTNKVVIGQALDILGRVFKSRSGRVYVLALMILLSKTD